MSDLCVNIKSLQFVKELPYKNEIRSNLGNLTFKCFNRTDQFDLFQGNYSSMFLQKEAFSMSTQCLLIHCHMWFDQWLITCVILVRRSMFDIRANNGTPRLTSGKNRRCVAGHQRALAFRTNYVPASS